MRQLLRKLPQSNSIGGLCWNYTHLINSMLHKYQSALNIVDALKTGKIHLAKEVTIVSAHVFREDGAQDSIGPIFSFATDGDATCHKDGHNIFLKTPIPFTSPLYGTLSNLPGLNMLTGDHLVTINFDFKHIFKHK
ncbi:hypothetical protein PAXRUDRAFT_29492 [Paxillus rubicundulus Ve08.2h10]|uniref:Uncharacterized protein n=1 Tax=Paxillus rubicundulus Ve08.2h10 TaxID=930991 RepID=A0A0D0DPA8_9AGAM|nr:hypothetical protein PAXRUDRAFT_29492 [Paxillus rubicundulus Ve08.2h10]